MLMKLVSRKQSHPLRRSRTFSTLKTYPIQNFENIWSDPSVEGCNLMKCGDLLYPLNRKAINQMTLFESQGKLTNVWNDEISQLLGKNSITFMNASQLLCQFHIVL